MPRFSLKAMLITICGLGAAVGMMGKLLLESPEQFLFVLNICSTIVTFLLATGTLVWLGWRDESRRRLIAWGCLLSLTPIIVHLTLAVLWPSHNPLRVLTNQRLIERRLPTKIDEPWIWRELRDRLTMGDLPQEDVEEAIEQLITYMKKTRPSGWNQPLAWQKDFIQAAVQAGLISDKVLFELCDAFFGIKPLLKPLPVISEMDKRIQLELEYGNPWTSNSGLGIKLLWDVKSILIDESPVKIGQVQQFSNNWSAPCDATLNSGDHQVTVEIECAYIDDAKSSGPNDSSVPVQWWPKPRKRWTTTISAPLKVESPATP